MKKYFSILLAVMFVSSAGFGQDDLQTTITRLAGNAAFGYVDPISQGFLTNLNGGLFHKAPQTKLFGIDLELGLAIMATPIGDLPKTFDANGTFRFNKTQADDLALKSVPVSGIALKKPIEDEVRSQLSTALQNSELAIKIYGPTILGEKYLASNPNSQIKIDVNSTVGFQYTVPVVNQKRDTSLSIVQTLKTEIGGVGGLGDLSFLPFAAPQITIGTLLGTQVTLRYLPEIELDKTIGKLSWTGFGVQHNLGYFLPIPIIDVAASFYTQTIKVGTIFEMKGTSFGLNASKQFGFAFLNVTPYAGFMLESSKMTVHIQPSAADFGPGVTPPDISFEIEGKNTSRLTVGLSVRLLIININADYNIGKYNSMTAGLFLAF